MAVMIIYDKVFKNEQSKICERQPLKNFIWSILEYFVPVVTWGQMIFIIFQVFIIENTYSNVENGSCHFFRDLSLPAIL